MPTVETYILRDAPVLIAAPGEGHRTVVVQNVGDHSLWLAANRDYAQACDALAWTVGTQVPQGTTQMNSLRIMPHASFTLNMEADGNLWACARPETTACVFTLGRQEQPQIGWGADTAPMQMYESDEPPAARRKPKPEKPKEPPKTIVEEGQEPRRMEA